MSRSAADSMKQKDKYVYFLYSEQQEEHRKKLEKDRNRTFIPGKVVVNGRRKIFTELSVTGTNNIYPDMQVVAEGWRSKMTFVEPTVDAGK